MGRANLNDHLGLLSPCVEVFVCVVYTGGEMASLMRFVPQKCMREIWGYRRNDCLSDELKFVVILVVVRFPFR